MSWWMWWAGCGEKERSPSFHDTGYSWLCDCPPPDTDSDSDSDADTDADADTDSDVDTGTDPPAGPWRHTIVVDGDRTDFDVADECFATSAPLGTVCVTWDETHLFLAIDHPDIQTGTFAHWMQIVLGDGDDVGGTQSMGLGSQRAEILPFAWDSLLYRSADGLNDGLLRATVSYPATPGFLGTLGSSAATLGTVLELGLPFDQIEIEDTLDLVTWQLYGASPFESSYAALPAGAFVDGSYDPNPSLYLHFDLDGTLSPVDGAEERAALPVDTSEPVDTSLPGETSEPADTSLPEDTSSTGDTGVVSPWSYPLTVDGASGEWITDVTFPTTSLPGCVAMTWDATDLYVGVSHPDVAGGGPLHWVVIYLGDESPGASVGVMINTQEPLLPFEAKYAVRWKADDSYNSLESWAGAWTTEAYWLGTEGSAMAEHNGNSVVEFKVPRALFVGDVVTLHVNWVYEGAGFESSYAASPVGSIADGVYDPDYGLGWAFDLSGAEAPIAATLR